jgi:hypothetical protein
MFDPPTLDELAECRPWDEDDDPPQVGELDIHVEDDIAAADAEAEEYWDHQLADGRCLPGCPHFGRCDNYPF